MLLSVFVKEIRFFMQIEKCISNMLLNSFVISIVQEVGGVQGLLYWQDKCYW